MVIANCHKCGATAHGETFEEASSKIDHAIGLSRGIKCGDNYNQVHEVKPPVPKKPPVKIEPPAKIESPVTPKPKSPKPKPIK